jgi:cation:H+ antiporter
MDYFYLVLGFIVLLISGDLLVKSAVALSSHFRVSTLVIGVTVVSFGTSLPELVVSVGAALKDIPDIAVGNVIGSNIANIALVLGFTAILIDVPVQRGSIRIDWPIMMVASLLFYFFVINGSLALLEGAIFIILLSGFIYLSVRKSRKDLINVGHIFLKARYSVTVALLLLGVSSVGLYFGATWLVEAAVSIASRLGVSERVISVSIIAFGTSLPELATSVMAALKRQLDISIGNIIGSNIFNIFGILGITSIIKRIPVGYYMVRDIYWMLGISVLLFLLMLFPLKMASSISRREGMILLFVYLLYIFLVFKS